MSQKTSLLTTQEKAAYLCRIVRSPVFLRSLRFALQSRGEHNFTGILLKERQWEIEETAVYSRLFC